MKLITIQHKNVAEILKNDDYHCEIVSGYQEDTPESYNFVKQHLKHECENPVFAWQRVIEDDINVSKEQLERIDEMIGFNEDHVAIVLDVPEEYVLLTDFYAFVDMRCIEEGIDEIEGFKDDFVLDVNEDCLEVQAIIPFIKKEWVKEVVYNLPSLI